MIRLPPITTRTYTLFPDTTLFRSPHNGVQPTRVVAYHASHHGPARRGGFGTKHQAVWPEVRIEVIADDARLYTYPPFVSVHFHYFIEMFGYIHHNTAAYHLPRE